MDIESLSTRFTAASFAVLAALLGIVGYRLWLHPLSRFPGPSLWAISRFPWIYHTSSGRMWYELQLLHEKYGSIVRIAPNELSFCNVAAGPDIYTSRPIMPKEPSSLTPPLNGAHSLFTVAGDDHRRLRGILVAGFSDKALRDQAPGIEHHASELIARLRREILHEGPIVDLHKFFGYAALDTITDVSYGGAMHGLEERNEHEWIARFFLHGRFSTFRMCMYWLYPLHRVMDFFVLSLTARQRSRNWAVFGGRILDRVSQGNKPGQRPDLISAVIHKVVDPAVKSDKDSRNITKNELLSHTLSSVVANSQSSTVTLTTCAYLLLRNQDAFHQVVDEIRQAFTNENQITVQSTQSLAYLEAAFHESMRLHHPTPITLPRVVPPEGRQIDGHFIPGKTIVGVNLHVIHTSPTHWVEPFTFQPARFLPHDDPRYDHKFDKDVKAAYQPFSMGPRNCIGGKLFFAEARVTLAKLLWNFNLVLAEPNAETWLDQKAFIVYEPKPLQVQLIDRVVG